MTAPCPAPPGCQWISLTLSYPGCAWALVSAAGVRVIIRRDGDAWALHGSDGTILRDAVTGERLPDAIAAAFNRQE